MCAVKYSQKRLLESADRRKTTGKFFREPALSQLGRRGAGTRPEFEGLFDIKLICDNVLYHMSVGDAVKRPLARMEGSFKGKLYTGMF